VICRVTNPHEFEVDGVSFLGTSGQNIDDIYKYSVEENRLTLLQRVLEWGHLVPTAPDTLTCYPLSDSDPFILQSAPHVFFVGNQPAYSSQKVTGTLLHALLLLSALPAKLYIAPLLVSIQRISKQVCYLSDNVWRSCSRCCNFSRICSRFVIQHKLAFRPCMTEN